MSRTLIIDDEKELATFLQDEPEARDHQVLAAYNGADGVPLAKKQSELIVLSIMIPEMDGLEVCQKIRDELLCPILFPSTKQAESDKTRASTLGGDDYVSRPLGLRELLTGIGTNLRRGQRPQYINVEKKHTELHFNEFGIDLLEHSVKINGEAVPLSKREYNIVEFLAFRAGQVFSRERIYERVWGYDLEEDSYTTVKHTRKIRKKSSEISPDTEYTSTVWGIGYKWNRIWEVVGT